MEPILANVSRREISYNLRQLMLIQQLTGRKGRERGINFFVAHVVPNVYSA